MLLLSKKIFSKMIIPSFLIAGITACSTANPNIAKRYDKVTPPEYQLVDTRFGTGNVKTAMPIDPLQRELMYVLYKLGCEVKVVQIDNNTTKMEFERPEAKGKISLTARDNSTAANELTGYDYTYRVNIVDYPATAAQDHHVNQIANELATTIKNCDMIQRAVCDNR